MFFRLTADQRSVPVELVDHFAGPRSSCCWIVGGGPSLKSLPVEKIAASSAPVFAVNLAGSRLLKPNFWTAYDPSARFHRSTYLDASVMKFLPRGRSTDLVPETTYKVFDCPGTAFFDLEGRDYASAIRRNQTRVLDWSDSFVMAIDIAFRLGFRRLYLVGCDMRVTPSRSQRNVARSHGIDVESSSSMIDMELQFRNAGVSLDVLNECDPAAIYHFDETKSFAATLTTDRHYDRIAQALRLSRRCFAETGLEIISATPGSRLNDYFEYQTVDSVCKKLERDYGNERLESERGRYSSTGPRIPAGVGPMRDYPPPIRKQQRRKCAADDAAFVDG